MTGAEGPELAAALKGFPLRVGMQEATGVEVSGSSGIHQGAEAENADVEALVAAQHHGAFAGAGNRGDGAAPTHAFEGRLEVVGLVERLDLRLIGKQHVYVTIHQFQEALAVPINTEAV